MNPNKDRNVENTSEPYFQRMRKQIGHSSLILPYVAANIRDAQGNVLLVKKHNSSIWSFPGGIVEEKEVIEDALKREIREELGSEVRIVRLRAVYSSPQYDFSYANGDQVHPLTFFFDCAAEVTSPFTPTEEIETVKFFSSDDLPDMLPCCKAKAHDAWLPSSEVLLR